MSRLLQELPWAYLLPVALLLGVMPVQPEPHLVEKLRMLIGGQLARPIDIFDLLLHGGPLVVILAKLLVGKPVVKPSGER